MSLYLLKFSKSTNGKNTFGIKGLEVIACRVTDNDAIALVGTASSDSSFKMTL